ncbi:MAG: sialidase family protein [Opitutales bacterium]
MSRFVIKSLLLFALFAKFGWCFEDPAKEQKPFYKSHKLFTAGEANYHSFRIPALVTAGDGTLIALCEGRVKSHHDFGDIDIVMKRSFDNGVTWGEVERVVSTGKGTWGNPTVVLERSTGVLFLFLSGNAEKMAQFGDRDDIEEDDGYAKIDEWGERRLYYAWSDNNGIGWTKPRDLTEKLVPNSYVWDAVGPGNGIQLDLGKHAGRLVIPAIGRNLISDDRGKTWSYEKLPSGTSESSIVELSDGRLMRNDRATGSHKIRKSRMVSIQDFEGNWSRFDAHRSLVDPVSQASILKYSGSPHRIIFLNAAKSNARSNMTLRMSYDNGITWPVSRPLVSGVSESEVAYRNHGGYSSLVKTAGRKIGILYEYNENVRDKESGRSIFFARANLGWLLNSAD